MPGSLLTCQGLSSVYDSFYKATSGTVPGQSTTFGGLTIDATTDTISMDTSFGTAFPFQTGDIAWYTQWGGTNPPYKYWVIRLSATAIKLATSYANALNNVAADLVNSSTSSDLFGYRHHITNSPLQAAQNSGKICSNDFFLKDWWQSSAFSSNQFGIQENLRIDFTISHPGVFAGLQTVDGSFSIGFGHHGSILNTAHFRVSTGESGIVSYASFPASGGQAVRITVQNRIITYSIKSGNSYSSFYATSPLTLTQPLRLFAFFALNNTFVSDCVFTYL